MMNLSRLFLISLVALTVLNACDKEQSFTLTLISVPENGGSVSGYGLYSDGDEVNISANANTGFEFLKWTNFNGDIISSQPSFTFTMPKSNDTLFAHFRSTEKFTLTLIISPEESGTVEGAGHYKSLDEVQLIATPIGIYEFVKWTDTQGNEISQQTEFIFTMPEQNDTLIAVFHLPLGANGYYIKGAGTDIFYLEERGLMKNAKNQVNQNQRPGLYEFYIAIKGGSHGFNIFEVSNHQASTLGPGSGFSQVTMMDRKLDEPNIDFWRGSFTETNTPFTVPADGLYHVVIDKDLGKVAIIPVSYWGVIGGATPHGWGEDTKMYPLGFGINTITYEVTDVNMLNYDFKFRYSGGWYVILLENIVHFNTNMGGSLDNLISGGFPIENSEMGKYTIRMNWTLEAGYSATMIKTGDLDPYDYSNKELGLVGTSISIDGSPGNWGETVMLTLPQKTGESIYQWTYENVELITSGDGFRIREGNDWSGLVFSYPDVIMEGNASAKITTNQNDNFITTENGIYNLTLIIDAATGTKTLVVTM